MFKFVLIATTALALSGCTTAQLQTANKYQADVVAECDVAKAALANPLAVAAMATVPNVAQAANRLHTLPDIVHPFLAFLPSPIVFR